MKLYITDVPSYRVQVSGISLFGSQQIWLPSDKGLTTEYPQDATKIWFSLL